jgi:hypothetical protein
MHCGRHEHEALARSCRSGETYILAAEGSGYSFGLVRVESSGVGIAQNLPDLRMELMSRLSVLGVATRELQRAMDG